MHMVDISNRQGLLDLIAVGNIIEFTAALDHRTYENIVISDEERLEQETAMTRYRLFMQWYSSNFGLLIGDRLVNPIYMFKKRLVSFGATVVEYLTREHSTVQRLDPISGLTPAALKRKIRKHLESCWPELVPAFNSELSCSSPFLYYAGPRFEVVHRARANVSNRLEHIDYQGQPLYMSIEECRNAHRPSSSHVAPKRNHAMISPTASTSARPKAAKRKR